MNFVTALAHSVLIVLGFLIVVWFLIRLAELCQDWLGPDAATFFFTGLIAFLFVAGFTYTLMLEVHPPTLFIIEGG